MMMDVVKINPNPIPALKEHILDTPLKDQTNKKWTTISQMHL